MKLVVRLSIPVNVIEDVRDNGRYTTESARLNTLLAAYPQWEKPLGKLLERMGNLDQMHRIGSGGTSAEPIVGHTPEFQSFITALVSLIGPYDPKHVDIKLEAENDIRLRSTVVHALVQIIVMEQVIEEDPHSGYKRARRYHTASGNRGITPVLPREAPPPDPSAPPPRRRLNLRRKKPNEINFKGT